MQISWIQKHTLVDYPGKVACTIFTLGCNFRCPFCHNKEFVLPKYTKEKRKNLISEKSFFNFLDKRKNFLDWVVVCGGEPTIQPDLIDFISRIKKKGLLVKLDTNGSSPAVLKELLDKELLDYIAMDIKYSIKDYSKLDWVGWEFVKDIQNSINLLLNSDIQYEFRTTAIKGYHSKKTIKKIAKQIKDWNKYYLQNFKSNNTLNDNFQGQSFWEKELIELKEVANQYIDTYIRD